MQKPHKIIVTIIVGISALLFNHAAHAYKDLVCVYFSQSGVIDTAKTKTVSITYTLNNGQPETHNLDIGPGDIEKTYRNCWYNDEKKLTYVSWLESSESPDQTCRKNLEGIMNGEKTVNGSWIIMRYYNWVSRKTTTTCQQQPK